MAATYNADGKEESSLIVTNSLDKGKNSVCTFMLKLIDEITFKDEKELIIYSDGPSSEFKNQFITGKHLYLSSQHLNLLVSWKYFATLHSKGVVDGIGSAAKARVFNKLKVKVKILQQ